jgi:hypothetical protein
MTTGQVLSLVLPLAVFTLVAIWLVIVLRRPGAGS